VIVEGSFEASRMDREIDIMLKKNKIKKMMPKLEKLFLDLDTDGSGKITLTEVMDSPPEVIHSLEQVIPIDDLQEVFELLDDGDGTVASAEFLVGIEKMALTDLPLEQFRMMKQISLNRHETTHVRDTIVVVESHIEKHFRVLEKHLNSVESFLRQVESKHAGEDSATLAPHHVYGSSGTLYGKPRFPPRNGE
jgi:hypothetical protein